MNRDNQQKTPTEGEIAWLAGIIECDGSVMLSAHCRKGKPKEIPKIGVEIKIYNTDAGIITKVVDILERLNVGHYITERPQKAMSMANGKSYGSTKSMISVCVKKLSAAYFLSTLIRPWLFGEKGHRLDLIIQFLARRFEKSKFKSGNSYKYDREDLQIVVNFYKNFVKKPSVNKDLVEGLLRD